MDYGLHSQELLSSKNHVSSWLVYSHYEFCYGIAEPMINPSIIHSFNDLSFHHLVFVCLHLSNRPLIHLSSFSVHLFVCASIHPSIYPFVHLSTHPSIHPSIHSSMHPAIHPSVHLSIHPSIWSSMICSGIQHLAISICQFVSPKELGLADCVVPCSMLTCMPTGITIISVY